METKWYALYTKSRWEKKVAEQLTKLNINSYCPLNKAIKQWSDRKKIIEEPLFTSYVFVNITAQQMTEVRKVLGVVNFVYWLGKPAVITQNEINTIQDFLSTHLNVKLEQLTVNVKDKIKIIDGPFSEMEGQVISVKKKSVRVLLPSLRYFMTAEVEIEKIINLRDVGVETARSALSH